MYEFPKSQDPSHGLQCQAYINYESFLFARTKSGEELKVSRVPNFTQKRPTTKSQAYRHVAKFLEEDFVGAAGYDVTV